MFISNHSKIIKWENAHSVVLVPFPLLPTSEGAGEGAVAGPRFLLREGIGGRVGGRLPFAEGVAGFDADRSNSGGGGEEPCACIAVFRC